ncbi:MAG: DUF1826 domain-containing protein [Roseobacter sp.]
MSFIRKTVKDAAVGVGVADNPTALDTFLKPGCAAAIWRRQTPAKVQSWLDRVDPDALPQGRAILRRHSVFDTVKRFFDAADLPVGPERDWLHKDVASLADMFSKLMTAEHMRLRLDVITTNACRKFHIDAITARLVCTYRGTGTQYGISTDGDDPKRVFTVQTGSPILLRGTLWPAQPASGLLHRSPPIEGTGETRLVLVLDPLTDPEMET